MPYYSTNIDYYYCRFIIIITPRPAIITLVHYAHYYAILSPLIIHFS